MHKLHLAKQAEVLAEQLTSDEHWDVYLSYIQAAKETLKTALDAYKNQLEDPRVVDHTMLMQLKIVIAGLRSQVYFADWVMELPKSIKETGKAAREFDAKLPV